jgi:hypothetical protein
VFWKILTGLTRTTIAINKSVTAVGFAIVVGVGVYDFMKARKERQHDRLR